jgi:hypothetical protein
VSIVYDLSSLEAARDHAYRRRPELALRDEHEALSFVEDIGFCLLFPARGMELPSLWEAINGSSRALPEHHDDRALGLAWEWKDSLPARRLIYYGKLLRRKPTLVALDMLPYFYALSENCGDPDDYLEHYRDGKLSEDGKRVYEAILEHGPLPTSRLRVLAGLPAKVAAARFDRAISELQGGLYIVKSGISDANAWKYCYVYDLLSRRFPEAIALARHISGKQARLAVASRYLRSVIAAPTKDMARLFGWSPALMEAVVTTLVERGLASHITVTGSSLAWLASTRLRPGMS